MAGATDSALTGGATGSGADVTVDPVSFTTAVVSVVTGFTLPRSRLAYQISAPMRPRTTIPATTIMATREFDVAPPGVVSYIPTGGGSLSGFAIGFDPAFGVGFSITGCVSSDTAPTPRSSSFSFTSDVSMLRVSR